MESLPATFIEIGFAWIIDGKKRVLTVISIAIILLIFTYSMLRK
ncbi:hypothetical protein AC93_4760 [Escherichia coli 2-005-03_S4_C2]|nr:hypothetical protein AD23_4915 [Escherichia coli 2-005-03_S4_C3]EZJ47341.1 hypothetical protein AC93_4760 [Escherichia coli 2-005-03_S4_C2]KDT24094.1 hypothetical protein AC67_4992 [Escherichia coli 2-052-05_S4_C1]